MKSNTLIPYKVGESKKIEESYDTQLPPIPTKEELNTDQDSSKEPDDLPF